MLTAYNKTPSPLTIDSMSNVLKEFYPPSTFFQESKFMKYVTDSAVKLIRERINRYMESITMPQGKYFRTYCSLIFQSKNRGSKLIPPEGMEIPMLFPLEPPDDIDRILEQLPPNEKDLNTKLKLFSSYDGLYSLLTEIFRFHFNVVYYSLKEDGSIVYVDPKVAEDSGNYFYYNDTRKVMHIHPRERFNDALSLAKLACALGVEKAKILGKKHLPPFRVRRLQRKLRVPIEFQWTGSSSTFETAQANRRAGWTGNPQGPSAWIPRSPPGRSRSLPKMNL